MLTSTRQSRLRVSLWRQLTAARLLAALTALAQLQAVRDPTSLTADDLHRSIRYLNLVLLVGVQAGVLNLQLVEFFRVVLIE